jgi:uncharacterized protein (DUF305 family)
MLDTKYLFRLHCVRWQIKGQHKNEKEGNMMMMEKAPEWIQGLSSSLEEKYMREVRNTNFLDLWVEYWIDHYQDAIDMFNEIGATHLEIKAWLYSKGNDIFEEDLKEEYWLTLI